MFFAPGGLAVPHANDGDQATVNVAPLGHGYLLVRSRLRVTQDGGRSLLAVPEQPVQSLQSPPIFPAASPTPKVALSSDLSELQSHSSHLLRTTSHHERLNGFEPHLDGNSDPLAKYRKPPHPSATSDVYAESSQPEAISSSFCLPTLAANRHIPETVSLPGTTPFARLLSFLEEQCRAGCPRARWTAIGADRGIHPSLYPSLSLRLKALLQQAESDGLVELGDQDRPGYEWASSLVALSDYTSSSSTSKRTKSVSSDIVFGTHHVPISSSLLIDSVSLNAGYTATFPSRTAPGTTPSTSLTPSLHIQEERQPLTAGNTYTELYTRWSGLVIFLRNTHRAGQLRVVSTQLGDYRSAHPQLFSHLPKKMKDLVMEAHAHGIVSTGGDGADRWVQLRPVYAVDSQLVGLVGFLRERLLTGEKQVKWKDIGEHRTAHPSSYPSEPRKLKPFLELARQAGIIRCGQAGQGQEWVELQVAHT